MAEHEVPTGPIEAPEADRHEQRRPVTGRYGEEIDAGTRGDAGDPEEPDAPASQLPDHLPREADPADAYEQARAVDYDEDDYR